MISMVPYRLTTQARNIFPDTLHLRLLQAPEIDVRAWLRLTVVPVDVGDVVEHSGGDDGLLCSLIVASQVSQNGE
jgi:hypothetical protein